MPRMSASTVEGLRCCIRSEYVGLPAEDLERLIESSLSGIPSDTAEDFLSTLGSFGKTVAPALQRAGPDVAQGAATGSTFGPWGAVIGAGAGLASSFLKPQEKPAPAPATPPISTSAPVASSQPTGLPAPPTLPTGQGAAATLLSLFQNPIVQQALLSQVLGSSGSQQVQTSSGTSLPRGAINALLSQLLTNASEALPESESISEHSYLRNETGEYVIDPASFDQHAALVLSHVQRKAPAENYAESTEWVVEALPDIESSEEWPEVDESAERVAFY